MNRALKLSLSNGVVRPAAMSASASFKDAISSSRSSSVRIGTSSIVTTGTKVVVNGAALEWRAIDLYDRDEILVDATHLVYRRTPADAAAVEHAVRWNRPW